jgi:hypothetical protein
MVAGRWFEWNHFSQRHYPRITAASGRSSSRRVWQTRDTYPVYGEHRRREIRPRSRFIEVPRIETRQLTDVFRRFALKTPVDKGV